MSTGGGREATRAPDRPGSIDGDGQPRPPIARGRIEPSQRTIATRHGRRDYVLRRGLVLADAIGVLAAGGIVFALSPSYLRPGFGDVLWLLPTIPLWMVLFRTYGLYDRDVKRIGHSMLDDLPSLFHAFVLGTLALWVYFRVLEEVTQLTYAEALGFGILGILMITLLRWVARRLVAAAFGFERVLLIGVSPLIGPLVRKMRTHPEYGLRPVGLVEIGHVSPPVPSLPMLGRIEDLDLSATLSEHEIERVIVAHEDVDDEDLMSLIQACGRLQIKVGLLPRDIDALGPSLQVDDVEGLTVLGLNPLIVSRSSRFVKRAMDLLGAGLALLLTSPLIALLAIAIKLDSRGPVLFRQQRIGMRGRRFTLLKFRTMVPDAERRTEELWAESDDPNWLKLERDPRITRVGQFLRSTSLDELPQLVNVLHGKMSLVGPRPLIPSEDKLITGWARTRLDLPPGITGLWQVLGRTSIPFEEMVKIDCLYVTNWSIWMDLKLIARTVPAVLLRRGVN